ncbi:MAG: ECF transporter S component [Halobacteriales archaeon]|nr:ECF transporter S component [Halobacteriales archaeon]
MSGQTATSGGFVERIRNDFTTVAWVLIPVGVGINVVGGTLVGALRIPLFLDVIGTILVAVLAGPWVAVVAGVLTNIILGFTKSPTIIPFGITNAAIAITAGLMAQRGWFRIKDTKEYWKLLVVGIVIALVATIVSAPISVVLFGGIAGGPTSVVTAFFLSTGRSIIESVLATGFLIEPVDKTASAVLAYFIAKNVPSRYRPGRAQEALDG